MDNNKNKRNITWKEFVTDFKFIIFIVSIVVSAIFFVTNADTLANERLIRIEDKIDTIENNHLVHIQTGLDNNTEQIESNQEVIIELLIKIKELQTLIIN